MTLVQDPADPGIIQAKNLLAKIHLAQRQIDKAEAYVNEVLEQNPKSVEGHFNKGNIYLSKGDGVDAVSEFRTVLNERPQMIAAYLRLAEAHFMNQELDLAADTLQKALKINPESKEVLKASARLFIDKRLRRR